MKDIVKTIIVLLALICLNMEGALCYSYPFANRYAQVKVSGAFGELRGDRNHIHYGVDLIPAENSLVYPVIQEGSRAGGQYTVIQALYDFGVIVGFILEYEYIYNDVFVYEWNCYYHLDDIPFTLDVNDEISTSAILGKVVTGPSPMDHLHFTDGYWRASHYNPFAYDYIDEVTFPGLIDTEYPSLGSLGIYFINDDASNYREYFYSLPYDSKVDIVVDCYDAIGGLGGSSNGIYLIENVRMIDLWDNTLWTLDGRVEFVYNSGYYDYTTWPTWDATFSYAPGSQQVSGWNRYIYIVTNTRRGTRETDQYFHHTYEETWVTVKMDIIDHAGNIYHAQTSLILEASSGQ